MWTCVIPCWSAVYEMCDATVPMGPIAIKAGGSSVIANNDSTVV